MSLIIDVVGISILGFSLSRAIAALRYSKKTFSKEGIIQGYEKKGFVRDEDEDKKKERRQKLIDFQSSH